MKKLTYSLTGLLLVAVSTTAFADKVTITGTPVTLEKSGDAYVAPFILQPGKDLYYVEMEGTKKVCTRKPRDDIQLEATQVNVMVGEEKQKWNCYKYDANYFTVQP